MQQKDPHSPLTNFFISGVLLLGISNADDGSCKPHNNNIT